MDNRGGMARQSSSSCTGADQHDKQQQQQQQQGLLRSDEVSTRLLSDPQHGHTAFIDALVELPAVGGDNTG
jgi:hypothetical protein